MKNFLRVMRASWLYRGRIILSVVFALIAGALWGLNISAVYPVLQILGNDSNMQSWVDQRINSYTAEIDGREKELADIKERQAAFERLPPEQRSEQTEHELTDDLNRVQDRLSTAQTRQWRFQQLKHHVIRHLPTDRFKTLAWILGMVIVAVALKGVFEFAQETLVGIVVHRTTRNLRNHFFHKALHQDLRQLQEGGSADLMSRFTNDIEVMGNGLKLLYGRVVAEPLRALSCVILACYISWQLTLLFLVIVPMALYVMTTASKMMKRASRRVLERMGNIYKVLKEAFQSIRVVKAFTMEPYERRRFSRAANEYSQRVIRVTTIDALTSPLIELVGVMAMSLALLAGAYLVLNGQKRIFGVQFTTSLLETGALLQLYAYLAGMADPVRKLSSVYTKVQAAAAAADRVYSTIDIAPSVKANEDGPRLNRHTESVVFQNVCFSYVPEKQVLTNICFEVKAGECIGIVGANGSGKSTLLNLLPRFYDPDHGSILIDGIDIRKANLRSLRRQIALVTQDPILFDDTIYNNIRYGSRRQGKEAIEAASILAGAHEFIVQLPQGYDTLAGDLGNSLSGGQKQRIALSRAILRDPSILILDEFSSAIDPVSDAVIHKALAEFKKGRTTFFITHKMHTLDIADRIIVIDNHQLVAAGTHAELLETCPIFQQLYHAHGNFRHSQSS
ncbi:MAG: ABC transporter ATP-binding protein [Zavarzinella sp.]